MPNDQTGGYDDRLLEFAIHPPGGWIRSKRTKMGITGRQLASKLGVTKQRISALEKAEISGAASLKSMRQAAEAMGCEFVYALIPMRHPNATTQPRPRISLDELLASPGFMRDLSMLCRHFEIACLGICPDLQTNRPQQHPGHTLYEQEPLQIIAEYSTGRAPLPDVQRAFEDELEQLFGRPVIMHEPDILMRDESIADRLKIIVAL